MIGFTQYVQSPTHRKGITENLLDHCWANGPRRFIYISVQFMGGTDHNFVVVNLRGKLLDQKERMNRKIKIPKYVIFKYIVYLDGSLIL